MIFIADRALRLEGREIAAAALDLDIDVAALIAVLHVETNGYGYDTRGRPAMLFEPHIFFRILHLEGKPALSAAIAAGLAYPDQGFRAYPPDSYPRLAEAMALDSNVALQSASWGIGQVMGYNWQMTGCESVEAMVQEAIESEANQLRHMLGFIRANHLDLALRELNWVAFAEGYNGRAEADNNYHEKLADAYAKAKAPSEPAGDANGH